MPRTATSEQFSAYQAMYDWFNAQLFGGKLKPVILNFSRMANTYGFFAPERWSRAKSTAHEISLNPAHLHRSMAETASTLAHEMVHCWQQEYGKPGRGRYHNAQWAAKMESIGLMPSSTGEPGGAKVGDRVSHYIIEGGPFERAYKAMPKSCMLPWSSYEAPKVRTPSKLKYTCPSCEANAWGKPDLNLVCGDCSEPMEAAA